MNSDTLGIFWLILSSLSVCALLFGNRYLISRENMAMIDKGMDPKLKQAHRPAPFRNLKWGLLLLGSGLGSFIAYILDNFVFYAVRMRIGDQHNDDQNVPIYFALIAIGGGIGLILSYKIESKNLPGNISI